MCNCALTSHTAIKNNLNSHIEDELPVQLQSDIEDDLEKKLSEYDLNLEDPNFREPKEEIKTSHIKETDIKSKLKDLLKSYDSVFSRSKFDVGNCSLISTKIPLINDTSKHIEPERKLRPEEFHQVKELINELLQHDIIAPADQTSRFCSNILTVPKPSDGQDPSKAAQNIRRHENKSRQATRVVIDLRAINKLTSQLPSIALSNYKDLEMEFKDTIVSTFDLSGFFFSLPLNFASQEATNFWFDGKIFKFTRCSMGAKNSSVFATMAGQLIFS